MVLSNELRMIQASETHEDARAPRPVKLVENGSNRCDIRNPLEQTAFLVQRHDTVCADICDSILRRSAQTMTQIFHVRSCLRRDSEFFFKSLLMMALKSISRASLRRSSFGFAIIVCRCPLDDTMVMRRGLASDFMISTSSSMPENISCIERGTLKTLTVNVW